MSIVRPDKVAEIVRDAGGTIVGRTRLQKIAYLLEVTGLGEGFSFAYKHYGPFSESVASSAMMGSLLGNLSETEKQATWGGTYSIYSVNDQPDASVPSERKALAGLAAEADSVALELAATAVFLSLDGYDDPWSETERRKPEKVSGGRLAKAKDLLRQLNEIEVPKPLPNIV